MVSRDTFRKGFAFVPMEHRSNCRCLRQAFELQYTKPKFWTVFGTIMVLILSSLVATSVSQQPSGFVSIDCGGLGGKDPITGLDWVQDSVFLDSANKLADEGVAVSAIVNLDAATAASRDNAEQLRTAMVFIPPPVLSDATTVVDNLRRVSRSKFCYNLNVTYDDSNPDSTNYLVRAMFPSRNLTTSSSGEELNKYGTRFYLTVDSTFTATIELDPDKPQTIELKVTPIGDTMYICLVPLEDMSSMPAISSLELRPLPVELYNRSDSASANTGIDSSSETTYFMTVARLNFGGNESLPAVRYPLDKYDRLWYPAQTPQGKLSEVISRRAVSSAAPLVAKIQPPSEVLLTAWEGISMSSEISFTFDVGKARSYRRLRRFVSTLLFLDINPGGSDDIREVTITNRGTNLKLNQTFIGELNVSTIISDQRVSELYDGAMSLPHHLSNVSIKPHRNSTLPAMINAVELYGTFTALTQRTENTNAATIIKFLRRFAHNLDTTGDACLPVPWSWLVCTIEVPPRITQIMLPRKGLRGELTEELGSLDRLTVLDLSENAFNGSLPQSLVDIVTLRKLNIDNNNLTGVLPLFREKSFVNLETLSLRNNELSGGLSSLVKALDSPVSSIDLSHNNFNGSIPAEIGRLTSLTTLDLSFNNLLGAVPIELIKLPELRDLSLQNNSLTAVVPDEIWSSKSKLETVLLDGNSFTELNLTTWSRNVLATKSLDENQPKVSLLGNKIKNVILPSEDVINGWRRSSPNSLRNTVWDLSLSSSGADAQGFILLGDSPWCQSFEKTSATLTQRYLCRSKENEDYWLPSTSESDSVSKRGFIIVGVISGLLVLVMVSVLLILLWRMLKRMRELHQIQEALAKDDVRPPFFKYEDLKSATRDFSGENELGKGAFGAVYKAVLADGSTVAVKRLHSTKQNITDFLKEVVLITGIKHRNLIQLKGCCVRDRKRLLVYEYAENRNLAEALWGDGKRFSLTWPQRFKICVGIARGLSYLHEELQPKIIHRDIKPQNILLDKDWNAKIADFGLARPADEDGTQFATSVGGTLGYFSPEYATLGIFTEKLDVYSYGVLVLEIVSGRRCINLSLPEEEVYLKNWAFNLYKEDRILDITERGLLATGSREEIVSVLKTALSCLQNKYDKRPSMGQVVNVLAGNLSDLEIDIGSELKDYQRSYYGLMDGTGTGKFKDSAENEVLALHQPILLSDSSQAIELSITLPR